MRQRRQVDIRLAGSDEGGKTRVKCRIFGFRRGKLQFAIH